MEAHDGRTIEAVPIRSGYQGSKVVLEAGLGGDVAGTVVGAVHR
jgi:hypothetical protein